MLSYFSGSASIEPNVRSILWKWAVTFSLCKSFLNPIIYSWRVKKMQRAFFEILHLRPENIPMRSAVERETKQQSLSHIEDFSL